MEERTKNYNPADYAAIEQKAKAMGRKELENAYVTNRDKSHTPKGVGTVIAILIIMGILLVAFMGVVLISESVNENLSDNIETLEYEICDLVGDYSLTIQEKKSFSGLDKIELRCVGENANN